MLLAIVIENFVCIPRFWLVFAAFVLFELWIMVSTFSNAYCNLVASCSLQPKINYFVNTRGFL